MPKECEKGFYSDVKGSYACKPCAPGKYQSTTGSAICLDCLAGKHNNVSGAVDEAMCVDCVPGKYSSYPGQNVCDQCPDGYFAPSSRRNTTCEKCGIGLTNNTDNTGCDDILTSTIGSLEEIMIVQGGALWVAFLVTGIFVSMAGFMTFIKRRHSERLPTSPGSKLYTPRVFAASVSVLRSHCQLRYFAQILMLAYMLSGR